VSKENCLNENELKELLYEGVEELCALVSSTLGPRGQNVLIQQKGRMPFTTKDGVTVAKFVDFEDNSFKNAGAQLLKQASMYTNSTCGDGTTTSTVLSAAIFNAARKHLAAGVAPIEIKRGIEHAVELAVKHLKESSKQIRSREDIANIAKISANGDEAIGKLIALAVDKIGKDGAITIEEARSMETSLEVIEGFRFDSGYLANAFVTDERRGVMKYDDPLLLITDERIDQVKDIMPVLEIAARDKRPLVIIAEEIEGQALAACVMNAMGGTMKVACVRAPRYGDERRNILKDMALSTGAQFVSREYGLELQQVKLEHLGKAKFIESFKNFTTIVGGKVELKDLEHQIEVLKAELNQTDDLSECERIQERITRLASGVAVIRVGGKTEVEMIEKKHRIEDALEAVKAAQEEGVVEGGGMALYKLSNQLEDKALEEHSYGFRCGISSVLTAMEAPIKTILSNAGLKHDVILHKIKEGGFTKGFNAASEQYVDLLDDGVIDPCKVTRCALQNAASVAAALIMTKCAIVEA
jgi:chaperonin GroEL